MINENSKVLKRLALLTDDEADLELAKEIDKTNQTVPVLIQEEVKKIPLQKGDQGDKGDSYVLTDADKQQIASKIEVPVVEKVIEKTEIIREQPIVKTEVKEITNNVENKDTPEQIADKLNQLEEKVSFKILKDTPTILTIEEILKALKNPKGKFRLELRDIKGAKLDMGDQRWHGGGISNITGLITAGTNVTITGSGTSTSPYVINASGGVLTDEKVKVSSADTTAGFLTDKFSVSGGLTKSITNSGANEVVNIAGQDLSAYLTAAVAAATYVPLTRTLTINGVTYDLSANRSWTITTTQTGTFTADIGDINASNAIYVGTLVKFLAPFSGTFTGWKLISNNTISGSLVIDVRATTTDSSNPTSGDSIAGSNKPTLSSQTSNSSTNMSTWTTTVTAGRFYWFYVESSSNIRGATLTVTYNKS